MGGRGRRSDWVLWSARNVPLPNELRPPVRLEYAGMLRDLCKHLEATVNALRFEPPNETPTAVRATLLHRLVRLHGMLGVVGEVHAARFEADAEVRAVRLRLERISQLAETTFEALDGAATRVRPNAADMQQSRNALRLSRREAERASEVALVATDHVDRFDLPHMVMLRSRVRRSIDHVVDALQHAGLEREASAMRDLMQRADRG